MQRNFDSNAHLVLDEHRLYGASAEILSVLDSSLVAAQAIEATRWPQIAKALDTSAPADERVGHAEQVCKAIITARRGARWIPRYSGLIDHEFANEFYSGYRDHSIHMLQVFLLGMYLYDIVVPLRTALDGRLSAAKDGRMTAIEAFLEWWTLTALWHDTGYPFEATSVSITSEKMKRQLGKISDVFNRDTFGDGLATIGRFNSEEQREIYRMGRFFPFAFSSPDSVLHNAFAESAIDNMWRRLGFLAQADQPTREIDRLCVQAPRGREPFHDHGIFSGALLATAAREAKSFLEGLLEVMAATSHPVRAKIDGNSLLNAVIDLEELWADITLAIEAISYHNFSTDYVDAQRLAELQPNNTRPQPTLQHEPHLFFLGLVDTLQDWDRHHFTPLTRENRVRPAVRAQDMLIQGDAKHVRVSVNGKPDAPAIVRNLLRGWLDPLSVNALISGDATFSKADKVLAASTSTIRQIESSQQRKEKLKHSISVAVEKSTTALISGGETAIVEASSIIGDCLARIDEVNAQLTVTDQEEVSKYLRESGLPSVEQTAFMRIKLGSRLALGTVTGMVGDGGFGAVWLVEDTSRESSHKYAFKLFHGQDLRVQEKRRLFKRGYDAMARLEAHPNIVRVHRFSPVPLGFFMDYIPGENLEKALNPRWTIGERFSVLSRVAETLAYAHSQGVLHRDVKPSNVLLDATREDAPILTDFDLAWIDGRTQHTRSQYATLHYGAPEQFQAKLSKFTTEPPVDVYGFGALSYFVLTGQDPPVHATWQDDHWDRLSELLRDQVTAIAVRELVGLLRTCTRIDPSSRLADMESVVDCLGKIANHLEAHATLHVDAWLLEASSAATGRIEDGWITGFNSRAGGLHWRFENVKRESGAVVAFDAICSLNREPQYEGVNYRGFTKSSIKQADNRVNAFNEHASTRATRRGQLGSGASMTIALSGLQPTKACARKVGDLLAAVARAVE